MAKSVRSVERVIEILTHLNQHNGDNSNRVANATGLARGTAYRMLETLEKIGLVERHGEASGYWLTERIARLSSGFDEEAWITNVAFPEIKALGGKIVWPAMLAIPKGIDMMVRLTTDANTSLVFQRHAIGHTVPMLGSASGRCFLAFAAPAKLEALLQLIEETAIEPWSGLAVNRARTKRMLREIRNKGFAVANSPEGGTISLAAPVLLHNEPCAVVATRYFKRSLSRADAIVRLADPLQKAAQAIGRLLEERRGDRTFPA